MQLYRIWTRRSVCFVAMCVASLSLAGAAQARRRPTLIPGTQLTGMGAFMGPVRTVPVAGIHIGYRQFGHGPELLMITGDTAPMSLWMSYLLKPLARSFHVTIFDNRGVGYSTDDLRQRMSVPLMAADTVRLIKALGLGRPTVVGWSMGGEIGITMAERYPATLARLVTTGADAGSRHTIPPPPGLIKKLKNPDNITAALQLLFPPSPAGQAAQKQFIQGYSAIPQESVSQTTLSRQASAENAFLKYPNVWNALGTIHTPVLLTNGQLDRGVPSENAKNLHRKIPGSRLTIYAGAAHGMLFQDANSFAAAIAAFGGR